MGSPPGWYPDPTTGAQRYWDGARWDSKPPPTPATKRRVWLIFTPIAIAIAVGCTIAYQEWKETRPVRDVQSDDPAIQSFYRELDANGFGDLRVKDALAWGREACNGNALALFHETDTSMANSFRFSTLALRSCGALEQAD